MEEVRIREIFTNITQGTGRDFITSDELAKFYPMMGCNGKRIRFHVNHSGLKASGRVNRNPVFCIKEVIDALEWKKNNVREGR